MRGCGSPSECFSEFASAGASLLWLYHCFLTSFKVFYFDVDVDVNVDIDVDVDVNLDETIEAGL